MRDTRPRPDSALTDLRDVRTPDGDGVRAARELSATVARLLSSPASA